MVDGSIRISTRIDNSKIDKDIVQLENKIKKLQQDSAKNRTQQDNLQSEIDRYEQLCQKADEYRNKMQELEIQRKNLLNGGLQENQVQSYERVTTEINNIKSKLNEMTVEIDKQAPSINKTTAKLEELKQKQTENNQKLQEYNRKLQDSQKEQTSLNFHTKGIAKPLETGIKKILRYGMALIGIRSVYGLLSSAMNNWLSGNSKGAKQLKSDIDYMKNAIGGEIGLGVGVGMLIASVSLGITLTLFALGYAYASYGQANTPYILRKMLGLKDIANNPGKPDTYMGQTELSLGIYITQADLSFLDNVIPNFKQRLMLILIDIIEDLVKKIKRLPYIGDTLGFVLDGILSGIKNMKEDITKTTTETIKSSAKDSTENANDEVKRQGIKTGTTYADSAKSSFTSKRDEFRKAIEFNNTNATNEAKNTVSNNGKTIGNSFADNIKQQISNSKNAMSQTISTTTENATNSSLNSANQAGKKVGTQITTGIKQGETSQQNSLSSNLEAIVKNTNNNVDTSNSKKIGTNIISGITSGINGAKTGLFSTMATVGSTLLSKFKNTLGIHSPSREMASLARFIPLGIAEGIDSTSDKALGSMKNLVYGLEDTMDELQYSNISGIPQIRKNAVSYVPRQAISTNEIQRSIVGEDYSLINRLLQNGQSNLGKNINVTIPLVVDGEEMIRKTIQLNDLYNLATNGGGL